MFFFFLLILSGYVSEAAKLGREDLPSCRSYSLEELMEATNNFDNSTFLGENIYGKVVSNFYFFWNEVVSKFKTALFSKEK